ncbi:hypothetical protein KZP21_00405 [Bifidobacterium pseudocatenulatum]|nr:hypothetical protein [Bifidobacterium pseudocatenulatum]MCB4877432.1 hypothetical protein [Bifidobacterium pseudocatenulatum]MCB4891662.1 hypothetical protein [Bifidobacterium pseudocatenulatum]MCB4904461.1 hypothetical protein [Bifidobacterium pseudocatenulatum]MCB4908052.1 hypothetical protein [Bifidobacterium pseudocatenulatum]
MTLDTYADLFDTDLDDVATSISNKITAAETLTTGKLLSPNHSPNPLLHAS